MNLQIQHIAKEFHNGTKALIDVDFRVSQGEFVSVIGPSGAGKTTLFRILNGMMKCTGGQVLLDDKRFDSLKGRKKRELQKSIATIYQDFCLVENSTCLKNVLTAGLPDMGFFQGVFGLYGKTRKEEALKLLDRVGLLEKAEEPVKNLSGGQKKRVAIAGVLAMNPKILILDEPTAGLDPKGRDEILDQIAELHKVRGITIILVSHSMEDVAKYVERLIVVNHGKIAFDDTPKKVFAHYKELEEMGLAAPQITYIMHALKEKGLPVDPSDTTVEEARADILRALKEMNSPLLKGGVLND